MPLQATNTNLSDLVNSLGQLNPSDSGVGQRLSAVKEILEDTTFQGQLLDYKITRMQELVVGQESDKTSLTALVNAGTWGTPGDPIGLVTAYGRLNALLNIIVQDTLLERIGEYTDTALKNSHSFWGKLKFVLDLFDIPSTSKKFTTLARAWCQSPLEDLITQVTNLPRKPETPEPSPGENTESKEPATPNEDEQGETNDDTVDTTENQTPSAEEGQKEDTKDPATEENGDTQSPTDPSTTTNPDEAKDPEDDPDPTPTEPPLTIDSAKAEEILENLHALLDWASGNNQDVASLFDSYESAKDYIGSLVTYTSLLTVFQAYTWSQLITENKADTNQFETLSTQLEPSCEGATELLATFKRLGKLTQNQDWKSFADNLGTCDDSFSRQPFTVCSHLHKLQSDLRGCISLLNKDRLKALSNQYNQLTESLANLQTNALAYLEEDSADLTDSVSSNLTNFIQTLQGFVKEDIKDLSPLEGLPEYIKTTFGSVESILTNTTEDTHLASMVRTATHSWPLIVDRINKSNSDIVTSVYTGKVVQPGLTLANNYVELASLVYLDPILDRLGRQGTQSHISTLLGLLSQSDVILTDDGNKDVTENVKNTLLLLLHLFERAPVIAFEKLSTTSNDSGDQPPENRPLYTFLNQTIGTRESTDEKSCFGAIKTQPNALINLVKSVKTQIREIFQTLMTEKKTGLTWPADFDDLSAWVEADNVTAALRNNEDVDLPNLKKELFVRPLVYRLTGLPFVEDTQSWRAKVSDSENFSPKGSREDPWFWLPTEGGQATAPTGQSLVNYAARLVEQSANLLSQSQDKDSLFSNTNNRLKEAFSSTNTNDLYDSLTGPFQDTLADFVTINESGSVVGDLASKLPPDSTLSSRLEESAQLLKASIEKRYPLDFAKILQKLTAFQSELPENSTDSEILSSFSNLGQENDHPADTTLFGLLNGIRFECGPQLLLNFVGRPQDTDTAGTLYAAVRKAENKTKLSSLDLEKSTLLSSNATAARQNLANLKGYISYYYPQVLVGTDLFKTTLSGILSSGTWALSVGDLTTSYDTENPAPWSPLKTLAEALAQTTETLTTPQEP